MSNLPEVYQEVADVVDAIADGTAPISDDDHRRHYLRVAALLLRRGSQEIERLASELAYLRDHPGWVAPQTGSEPNG